MKHWSVLYTDKTIDSSSGIGTFNLIIQIRLWCAIVTVVAFVVVFVFVMVVGWFCIGSNVDFAGMKMEKMRRHWLSLLLTTKLYVVCTCFGYDERKPSADLISM